MPQNRFGFFSVSLFLGFGKKKYRGREKKVVKRHWKEQPRIRISSPTDVVRAENTAKGNEEEDGTDEKDTPKSEQTKTTTTTTNKKMNPQKLLKK